jgi:hypothetical protein
MIVECHGVFVRLIGIARLPRSRHATHQTGRLVDCCAVRNRAQLDEAARRCDTTMCAFPMIRCLGGKIGAHASLGVHAKLVGRRESATDHGRWVVEQGNRRFRAYALAAAELERVGETKRPRQPTRCGATVHAMRLWNVTVLVTRASDAMAVITAKFGQSSAQPAPRRMTPRAASIIQVVGTKWATP